jgi:ABC-type Fe3+-siderophore transport system permease subunit
MTHVESLLTLTALFAGLALAAAMIWLERKPRARPEPRLIPTTPIMFLGLLIVILAAAHLLALTRGASP